MSKTNANKAKLLLLAALFVFGLTAEKLGASDGILAMFFVVGSISIFVIDRRFGDAEVASNELHSLAPAEQKMFHDASLVSGVSTSTSFDHILREYMTLKSTSHDMVVICNALNLVDGPRRRCRDVGTWQKQDFDPTISYYPSLSIDADLDLIMGIDEPLKGSPPVAIAARQKSLLN